MRLLSVLSILVMASSLSAEAVPFDQFAFADGHIRSAEDFAGQAVVVAYFCSN